ncbi:MAG: B12-binding domain-containing radical SAM protein, partial [Proteobacteria bacterium]|nr:B12-binding domain-containing radical SAM protein [Pseudomonadota bacterium]
KDVILAASRAKEDIITVVGGGMVSSQPSVVMEGLGADLGVIGEGEITVCNLADSLEKNLDLAEVDGLIYKKNGRLHTTRARKEISDLATIPWPDYEGFGFSAYLDTSKASGKTRYAYMLASRSCPFDCTFCYHPVGKKYRQRSLDDFFRELDFMLSHYRIEYLGVGDELFSLDRDRTRDFCELIKERAETYGINWSVQLRADHVDRNLIDLLKYSGCNVISYGVESADNTILKSMKKHITVEQIENALKLTKEAKVGIQGALIFGDIEETWEKANNSLKWWEKHREYHLDLTYIRVFPGAHIYRFAYEHGIIKDKLKYLEDNCPLINISKMSENEYKALEKKFEYYQKKYSYTPDAIEILGISGSGCRLSIVCGKCKGRSEQTYSPLSRTLTGYKPICPHCRERMNINDAFINHVFTLLFQDRRKVAVWGCGDSAQKLFERSKSLRENHIFVVDNNIKKQGSNFWGHRVASPSIIPDKKIDTVIIASMRAEEISNEIAYKFPEVEKIIKPADLATIFKVIEHL